MARVIIKYCLLFLAFSFVSAGAQTQIPSVSEGDLKFYADHAVFRGAEENLLFELYLMLYADDLPINQPEFKAEIEIRNIMNETVKLDSWTTNVKINGGESQTAKVIYDQWSGYIPPGTYHVMVKINSVNGKPEGKIARKVKIEQISSNMPAASLIEFASEIAPLKSTSSHFAKQNKNVVPNPARRYGVLLPMMYVYYELYNIPENIKLNVGYTILSQEGETVKKYPDTEIKPAGESAAINHGLNVSSLPTGVYTLLITAEDASGEDYYVKIKDNFEVIQPDFFAAKSALTEKEAETAGNYLQVIAPGEFSRYEKLNMEGKAQFLLNFWKNLDPTPGTDENEYLEKLQARYLFANENFGWGQIPGWKTDKGRILIKYGNPDEIERHYSESDTAPYEIWHYRQDREFIFVFADLQANGKYILLHSTREGEVRNRSWRNEIERF